LIHQKLETTGVMRASLFNLIVVAPENERQKYLQKITQKVIEQFPCRIFLIKTLKTGSLKVNLSTHMARGIACDLIEIEAPESELSKIPFLILPHFLSDLPIYLLWAQDPLANEALLHQLQKWATRFIYDSETAQDLSLFSQRLLSQHQGTKKEVADLNWARTESWRDLLAATFYSDARLHSLKQAKTIEIHYNALETPSFCHTKIQAIYLMAWLTTRIGFSPKITFHPQKNHHLPPGAIISLEILSNDQTHFSFHRDSLHPDQVLSVICDEEKCDIPSHFILSKTQAGLSLVNQIYHSDPSSHFSQVLQFLKEPSCSLTQN
jgi:hypothetical protein